jgi:hypothetical protein
MDCDHIGKTVTVLYKVRDYGDFTKVIEIKCEIQGIEPDQCKGSCHRQSLLVLKDYKNKYI